MPSWPSWTLIPYGQTCYGFLLDVHHRFHLEVSSVGSMLLCLVAPRSKSSRKPVGESNYQISSAMSCLRAFLASVLVVHLAAQSPGDGYSREQLLPLTKYRQQHRRTIDGRLCGWASAQGG